MFEGHAVPLILALTSISYIVLFIIALIKKAEGRLVMNGRIVCFLMSRAHSLSSYVRRTIKILRTTFLHFCFFWVNVTFNNRLEHCTGLAILQRFVQLDRLLKCLSLIHDVFVFDRDHPVVHVGGQFVLFTLLLISETRVASAKRIHLIALADLVAQCVHFVLHQLVVQVGARTWILPDLLWDRVKKFARYDWLESRLWF